MVALAVLAVSAATYLLTIEPTASFWDCGEFIASSYKLEVGHPPGNPVFQLFARIFTLFTDGAHAAVAVNAMSALCSALTIFLLYLTIVFLAKRVLRQNEDGTWTTSKAIAIFGSGAVGALAYCFSDTFWFSAVEGEVYAMSSLFTALVFWAMTKWYEQADTPYANRWIVLISFLMGLSIGIHLLNLLAIPALVFLYYYKKREDGHYTFWEYVKIFAISCIILAVVLFGIIPYLPKAAAYTDLFFVNTLGLPFNSGAAFFMAVLLALCFWGLFETMKKGKVLANTILLCFTTITIGFSLFSIVIIRSNAKTPTNEYQPDNAFTLIRYLSREQYGSTPLIYGQYFDAPYEVETTKYWTPLGDRYIKADGPGEIKYQSSGKMLFPRMWSNADPKYITFYESYMNGGGKKVAGAEHKKPTFWQNLSFFFDYQMNWMYWRYFMWNFAGRQNEIHSPTPGDIFAGNWECGIPAIDEIRLGDQSDAPDYLKDNKGKNHYFLLPLLLGLIGLFFQFARDKRGMWLTFLLFFMTGIAIVLYLNQPPYQVRERDYAYAGSFYAFAIWIGMGVAGLAQLVEEYLKKNTVWTSCLVTLLCLLVPVQMASQTWDDHDRSGRYFCSDFGKNYLMSLPEEGDPVIFTNGDNDTFPLWYNQETEGFRTDARTCNLSYLNTDWYIDQMLRASYESPALPISWSRKDYGEGVNDYVRVVPEYKKSIEELYKTARHQVELAEKGLKEDPDNPSIKADADALHKVERHFGKEPFELKNILRNWVLNTDDELRMIPTDSIVLTVDKDAVRRSGMLIPGDSIPDKMVISLKGKHALYKNELMILELLSQMNWERPLFMAVSVGSDSHLGLTKYFIQEGLAYRFTPFDSSKTGVRLDSEKMYDNLMNKFRYGNLEQPGLYIDENAMRMCASHRRIFSQLITQLVSEDKKEKAEKALDYCLKVIPEYNVPYRWENGAAQLAESSYMLGKTQLADDILLRLIDNETSYLTWYLSLDKARLVISSKEFEYHLAVLDALVEMFKKHPESSLNGKSTETGYKFEDMIEDYYQMFSTRLR